MTASTPKAALAPRPSTQDRGGAVRAMIGSFLTQQRLLTDQLGMRPTAATVYLAIIQASMRASGPERTRRRAMAGGEAAPATGSISRRGLAAATGVPRETVRRIVCDLINDGHVIDLGRAGVRSRDDALPLEGARSRVRDWAAELGQLCDELASLGMLAARKTLRDRTQA